MRHDRYRHYREWREDLREREEAEDEVLPLESIFSLLTEAEIEEEIGRPLQEVAPRRIITFRGGRKHKKWICPNQKKGDKQITFRAVKVKGRDKPKCERMSASEQKKLSRKAKKAAKKRRPGQKAAARKRARTNRKRRNTGN